MKLVRLGPWVCGESWAHKRLFNLPSQFSRLGTQGPALLLSFVFWCLCFGLLMCCASLWLFVLFMVGGGGGFVGGVLLGSFSFLSV